MAGLSCASMLQAMGLPVSVFEKSRGLGGRLSTRRGDGWQCDHGAPGFEAKSGDFRDQLDRWQAAGAAQPWKSAGQYTSTTAKHANPHSFVGTPRMNSPARLLASTLNVRRNARVDEIRQMGSHWQIRLEDQAWLESPWSAIVIAVPAPQAATLLRGVAPGLAKLADEVPMTPCWSVIAQSDGPAEVLSGLTLAPGSAIETALCDRAKPARTGKNCWLLQATVEWSEKYLEAKSNWVCERLVDDFQQFSGIKVRSAGAHRWRYARAPAPALIGSYWDGELHIGLCGDWLCQGSVEGAWRSGRQLAARLRLS